MVQAFVQWHGVTELSAALYMTSARYFYNAHEMELFHHDYTHTSGLLGLVKATSCILTVRLRGQKFLITSPENHLFHSRAAQKYNASKQGVLYQVFVSGISDLHSSLQLKIHDTSFTHRASFALAVQCQPVPVSPSQCTALVRVSLSFGSHRNNDNPSTYNQLTAVAVAQYEILLHYLQQRLRMLLTFFPQGDEI